MRRKLDLDFAPLEEVDTFEVHDKVDYLIFFSKEHSYSLWRFLQGVMQCPTLTRLLQYMSHFNTSPGDHTPCLIYLPQGDERLSLCLPNAGFERETLWF